MKTLMQDTNGKFLLKIFLLFSVLTLGLLNNALDLDEKIFVQYSNKILLNTSAIVE